MIPKSLLLFFLVLLISVIYSKTDSDSLSTSKVIYYPIAMSIQPRFATHIYSGASVGAAPSSVAANRHTIDLYLDYDCPFSAKMFKTLYHTIFPTLNEKYAPGSFSFVFRQVPQPWHPTSTLLHEVAIAVEKLDPSKFWQFSDVLFQHQAEYFDTAVFDEPRSVTYSRLIKLASESTGLESAKLADLLTIAPSPDGSQHNYGNKITADLKLFIRQHRQMSVHVTPTVTIDGILNNDISSGWTADQWFSLLDTLSKTN
ncbi:thioredoxin-like protein [Dipodascopsis uninucleata]